MDALTQQWEEYFKALVAYKAELGDCLFQTHLFIEAYSLDVSHIQRRAQDKLIREKCQRLNDLGFVWDANIYTWEKHFTTLVAYKAEFGDY